MAGKEGAVDMAVVFPDLGTAAAAFQLGRVRFACRVCGRVHTSRSQGARACAKKLMASISCGPGSLDDPLVRGIEDGLWEARLHYAPWLRVPWSGLPLVWQPSAEDWRLFAASLAVGASPGEVERELRACAVAARKRWLAAARAQVSQLAEEYRKTAAEAVDILSDPGNRFEFDLRRGKRGDIEYLRPVPAGWVPAPRRVALQEASGTIWAHRIALAAGIAGEDTRHAVLWEFRYSAGVLVACVSPRFKDPRHLVSVALQRRGLHVNVSVTLGVVE